MSMIRNACLGLAVSLFPLAAQADTTQVGVLSCDVSAGLGLFVMQKQGLTCVFKQQDGTIDSYTGSLDQFGVALGEVEQGHLVWGVLAATSGLPKGALAGTYAGVGANASIGVGAGANVLVGGTGRAFSLQPISVQDQAGINIAGGVTTVTLKSVP